MKERGLTLVEILVVMGIVVIVGALLMVIIVNSAGLYTKQSSKLQAGLNINDTFVQIRSSIKDASSIAPSHTTYTTGPTQLILKLPSLDSSGNIIPDTFDYYVYFLDTNKIRLKTFPDVSSSRKAQDQILSTLVDGLYFQYLDSTNQEITPASASKVRITLTLKQKTQADSFQTDTATSEANLRND